MKKCNLPPCSEKSGAACRTIREARIRLGEFGLIKYERSPGDVYKYTICNPETGKPFAENVAT